MQGILTAGSEVSRGSNDPLLHRIYNSVKEILFSSFRVIPFDFSNLGMGDWEGELEDLYRIDIKSLYKGKGEIADLQNQRGLFLSSVIIKLYEKMMIQRGGPKMYKGMSQYQAGGRPEYSITEQTFILRSIIENQKYNRRKLYAQFFDLKKCFDKMVLKNIMSGLWKVGIRGRLWRNLYKINEKAKIRIKTAHGHTEEIEIGETLKQGSVVASSMVPSIPHR